MIIGMTFRKAKKLTYQESKQLAQHGIKSEKEWINFVRNMGERFSSSIQFSSFKMNGQSMTF